MDRKFLFKFIFWEGMERGFAKIHPCVKKFLFSALHLLTHAYVLIPYNLSSKCFKNILASLNSLAIIVYVQIPPVL